MRMIITRPEHDVTTRYLSSWAEEVIVLAREKGVDSIDLRRDKASREELEGRIKKVAPEILFLNGHGHEDRVAGHDNQILVQLGDNHAILKDKITYALSCDSAKGLGAEVVKDGVATYIGYVDEFIFMVDSQYITKPLQDQKANPFRNASNQVMKALFKGHSAQEASARSKQSFRNHYTRFSSSKSDPDSLQMAQFLWWNMRHQVCLGNGNARIVF